MALFVFFAAAARAWIVATDFWILANERLFGEEHARVQVAVIVVMIAVRTVHMAGLWRCLAHAPHYKQATAWSA